MQGDKRGEGRRGAVLSVGPPTSLSLVDWFLHSRRNIRKHANTSKGDSLAEGKDLDLQMVVVVGHANVYDE